MKIISHEIKSYLYYLISGQIAMPPVSWPGVLEVEAGCFPTRKEAYRVGGEGGPLGTGRCSTSLYKEALVNPKSSPGLSTPEFVDKSVSCLLEHCLGWDTPLEKEEAEEISSPLLEACSPLNVPTLCRLLSQGCDPNLTSSRGRNALHLLITSTSNPSTCPHLLLPAASVLLQAGASLDQRDLEGSTPLVSLVCLLEQKQFAVAAQLAALFLASDSNCDVNSVNQEGRSLLSYSVTYLDSSAELTRLLVNHGARVWPSPTVPKNPTVDQIRQDKEQSAFTWFLRAVIKQRTLASTDTTLNCLSHEMGKQPRRMKVSFRVALYVLPNFTSFSGPRVEGDGVGRPPPKSPRTGIPPVEALHGALLVRDTLLLLSPNTLK